eukprot:m.37543 g.37543  ORF g.37543 m.37543 type:complete len:233 (-) comp13115_c0_seq1:210-908(-)
MIGITEMAFISAVGLAVIGPTGMPKMARQAGRTIGQALRFLRQSQAAISTFSKENQLNDLKGELEQGIDEVNKIRNEWQSMTSGSAFKNALFDSGTSRGGELQRGGDLAEPPGRGVSEGGHAVGSPNVEPPQSASYPPHSSDTGSWAAAGYSMDDPSHVMASAEWRQIANQPPGTTPLQGVAHANQSKSFGGARFVSISLQSRRVAEEKLTEVEQRRQQEVARQHDATVGPR